MNLMLIVLDTMFRGVAVVGIYLGGRYLYRQARQGFPSLNDPSHRYAEAMVHSYKTIGATGLCLDLAPHIMYFHAKCADEYLNEMVSEDIYFEVWLNEEDTECSCEYCG
jgi:hypothetical protein